jgi:acyl dehydratase
MTGKYYEDFKVGDRFEHGDGHMISEEENLAFCKMTENEQRLHIDAEFGNQSAFGQRIVTGLLTMSLVVGMSVEELTDGTIVGNLGYEVVKHPKPVFHGDTVRAESEVLDKRESKSKPHLGIVRLKQIGRNQKGEVVVELERSVLVMKRSEENK